MIHPDVERIALLGWHVYPQSAYSRAGCFEGAHAAATDDLDTIDKWCQDYPGCNWRVVFGSSGLVGFDCDVPPLHLHDGVAAMAALVEEHGQLPPRPTARSGSGGVVLIFKDTGAPMVGASGRPKPGIDPRRGAQSQTVPPSIHNVTKKPYRWLAAPWEVNSPPAPQWLLDLVKPPPAPAMQEPRPLLTGDQARNYAVGALYNAVRRVASAGKGGRNDVLNRETYALARFVRAGALAESELRDALYAAANANGMVGEDGARSALLTIDSGLKSRRR